MRSRPTPLMIATALLAAVISLPCGAAAATGEPPLPSWFPTQPCSPLPYDYATDAHPTDGGNDGYAAWAARAHRRDCRKPWTILVYMAADNDLAPYAYWDLYEMEAGFRSHREAAGSTVRSDLLVQLATPESEQARRIHVFQTPEPYDDGVSFARFQHSTQRDVRSPIVARIPRRDPVTARAVPEAQELQSFLEWGMREYPAEHYMVIAWGHGQGWAPLGAQLALAPSPFAGRRFGGLAFDQSTGTYLDIPSLHATLAAAERDVLNGRRVDIYASDACLMQMVEVATEISDTARFIVGSSQVENFLGLPYRRMMFELNTARFGGHRSLLGNAPSGERGSAMTEPELLARIIPYLLRASLGPGGLHARFAPQAIQTVTMSSISSDELRERLLPAMEALASAISGYLGEDPARAIDVTYLLRNAPTFEGGAQEIGAFLTLLEQLLERQRASSGASPDAAGEAPGGHPGASPGAATQALGEAIIAARAALDRAVIAYALGTRYAGRESELAQLGFRAFSVWLPGSAEEYLARAPDFASSLFYRYGQAPGAAMGPWQSWLALIFGGTAR